MPNSILLLHAHPAHRYSTVNRALFERFADMEHVTPVDLYSEYPRYHIDVDKEQQRLREHDVVIFQFPMFWYSTPALLKEWQDLVLEYGFAYGPEGLALENKRFIAFVTTGAAGEDYTPEGHNRATVRQLLHPLEQMAILCKMQYLPPLVLHKSLEVAASGTLSNHVINAERVVNHLIQTDLSALDWDALTQIDEDNIDQVLAK